MTKKNVASIIKAFLNKELPKKLNGNDCYIYNEFSLQHELGIYLRKELGKGYKVQFERNIKNLQIAINITAKYECESKSEIDIIVLSPKQERLAAIELKFPRNEQHPEEMYSFCKDIRFMEDVSKKFGPTNGFKKTFCLTLVDDDRFYSAEGDRRKKKRIYKNFRTNKKKIKDIPYVTKKVHKPTGNDEEKKQYLRIKGSHKIVWKSLKVKNSEKTYKYYFLDVTRHLETVRAR